MKKNKIYVKLNKLKGNKFISSSKREYIGLIKINLDNGQSEYLKIYTNSNSDELAYNFCLKHKIDFSVVNKLILKINDIKDNKISTTSKEKAEISFNIRNSTMKKKENKNREINGLNNFFYNENNLTPINNINNEPINNLYDTEERLIPNMFYNGKMINKQLDYKNTEKKDFLEDNKNNNDIDFELNDSLNDKLNNLEKAYNNFNPENKAKNGIKEGNTKEVIDSTIQECMDIIEKEESNNFAISSPDYSKNYIKIDKENKSTPLSVNNYLFSTPKIRQNETFSGSNINNTKINKFNNSSENKENIYNNFTKNKNNNLIMNKKLDNSILSISIINKKYRIKNNKNINNKNNINDNNNDSYFNTINQSNINNNTLNRFNQTDIEHNIEFSLITKKRNYLFLCSNKDTNNTKPQSGKTIPISKNSTRKFHLINKKYYNLQKNDNSSFFSQNKKYILYNDNKNSFKTITNYSSLKTIPTTDNENPVFSTIKTNSNCELMSSNVSDKSTYCQNRVTSVFNSNYSNMITRGSTNIKLFKKIDAFNSNKLGKINKIRKPNYSNGLLYNTQKEKKKNLNYNINNCTLNPENTINLKNINRKIKKGKKKKLIIVNNSIITDYSFNKIKEKNTKTIFVPKTTVNKTDYLPNKYKFHSIFGKQDKNNTICRNRITLNLIEKNEIINSFKNIFNLITKNNKILDAFTVVNKNNIPSPIYEVVKTIVKNCNNKNRFIDYNDFINMAFILFDKFSNEEKISILNYKRYF